MEVRDMVPCCRKVAVYLTDLVTELQKSCHIFHLQLISINPEEVSVSAQKISSFNFYFLVQLVNIHSFKFLFSRSHLKRQDI